jgi:hypothetical protein
MRAWRPTLLAILLLLAGTCAGVDPTEAADVKARVAHHLRHVEHIADHFETLIAESCPRFPSCEAWDTYVDGETDRLVLLVAHLEQAWIEAKRGPDDEIRRAAKAPRRQADQMRLLMDKLNACAEMNGASFAPHALWRRVERDVPRRQAEIALPQ